VVRPFIPSLNHGWLLSYSFMSRHFS
jgi:hypothetical protein